MKPLSEDIRVSPVLDRDEADRILDDLAASLRALRQTDDFGVFVAPLGDGYAVYLRNRKIVNGEGS